MQQKTTIENKVNEALESLNGIRRASPGDHFYTRLVGRLQYPETSLWEKITAFIARPAVAFSVFAAVLLSNGFAIFNKSSHSSAAMADRNERTITEEYNQDFVAFYDPENVAP